MDDLVKCLYEFVQTHRMGGLNDDEEYQEYTKDVKLQKERVREYLTEEQQIELNLLIDAITAQDSIESEYLFQSALTLSGELNALLS